MERNLRYDILDDLESVGTVPDVSEDEAPASVDFVLTVPAKSVTPGTQFVFECSPFITTLDVTDGDEWVIFGFSHSFGRARDVDRFLSSLRNSLNGNPKVYLSSLEDEKSRGYFIDAVYGGIEKLKTGMNTYMHIAGALSEYHDMAGRLLGYRQIAIHMYAGTDVLGIFEPLMMGDTDGGLHSVRIPEKVKEKMMNGRVDTKAFAAMEGSAVRAAEIDVIKIGNVPDYGPWTMSDTPEEPLVPEKYLFDFSYDASEMCFRFDLFTGADFSGEFFQVIRLCSDGMKMAEFLWAVNGILGRPLEIGDIDEIVESFENR